MTLVQLQMLCAPASVATGGALLDPPAGLDNFACYSVRRHQTLPRMVTVADGIVRSVDELGSLIGVCAPASVDGSKIVQSRLLACYRLASPASARPAIVRSRFALLKASPGLRSQLCVPSVRL